MKTAGTAFAAALAGLFLMPARTSAQWNGYAGDPQHTAISAVPSQPLLGIRWSTPVDETNPSEPIYIHYGSTIPTPAASRPCR